MNERLRYLRKFLELSQEDFATKLGITGGGISKLEKGERNFTEQMIRSICREFNVDYIWLTTGEGEMFTNIPDTILDELVIQYNLDDLDKSIIQEYLNLDSKDRNVIKTYIQNVFIK